jgi:hypothetical protein
MLNRGLFVVLSVIVTAACSGRRDRADAPPGPTAADARTAPSGPASRPAALFLGPDARGRLAVFQLAVGQTALVPVALPGLADLDVLSALPSLRGTALVLLLQGPDGRRSLARVTPAPHPEVRRTEVSSRDALSVRAVDGDGEVVALERPGGRLAVVRLSGSPPPTTDLDPAAQGQLVYGVALSEDGARLAFSTMARECASAGGSRAAACAVSLHGVDLGSAQPVPRVLAGGPSVASYDPQLLGPAGDRLMFMTNEGDRSERCLQHFNQCAYALREVPWRGGPSRLVAADAALGLRAAEGTLVYRRLGETGSRFDTATLVVVPPGRPAVTLLPGQVSNRRTFIDPGARFVLVETRRPPVPSPAPEVWSLDGRSLWQGPAHPELRSLGWLRTPLATRTGELRPPRAVRCWDAAIAEATRLLGSAPEVGVLDRPGAVQVPPAARPQRFSGAEALLAWLGGARTRAALLSRDQLCGADRSRLQAAPAHRFLGTGEDELVLLLSPLGARAAVPPGTRPVEQPLARFEVRGPGEGEIELLSVDLPARARVNGWIPIALRWRFKDRPITGHRVFVHLETAGHRILGDHQVAACGPLGLQAGEEVLDRFWLEATTPRGVSPTGAYRLHVGWFQADRRARLTHPAPSEDQRALVGTLSLTE